MNKAVWIALAVFFATLSTWAENSKRAEELIIRHFNQQNILPSGISGNSRTVYVLGQKIRMNVEQREIQTVNWIFIWDLETMIMLSREGKQEITLILKKGQDLWLFKKGLRVPLRINLSYQLNKAVNLFDVLQVRFDQYEVDALKSEDSGITVELSSSAQGMPYPKMTLTFNTASKDLERAVFKGVSGKEIKEIRYSDYKTINGSHRFPVMTILNLLFQTADTAEITYFEVKQVRLFFRSFSPQRESFEQFLDQYAKYFD